MQRRRTREEPHGTSKPFLRRMVRNVNSMSSWLPTPRMSYGICLSPPSIAYLPHVIHIIVDTLLPQRTQKVQCMSNLPTDIPLRSDSYQFQHPWSAL